MYEIMTADEAIRLIRDGDCICVNSFVGIENPIELHEAIYRRYQKMQSPTPVSYTHLKVAVGILRNDSDAADAIQESILTCYERMTELKKPQYFKTWLLRILINNCNQMLRERKKVIGIEQYLSLIHIYSLGYVVCDITKR